MVNWTKKKEKKNLYITEFNLYFSQKSFSTWYTVVMKKYWHMALFSTEMFFLILSASHFLFSEIFAVTQNYYKFWWNSTYEYLYLVNWYLNGIANTNFQIWRFEKSNLKIWKFKFKNSNLKIQIWKFKFKNSNLKIQIWKFKNSNLKIQI